jgi:hypothetical protein
MPRTVTLPAPVLGELVRWTPLGLGNANDRPAEKLPTSTREAVATAAAWRPAEDGAFATRPLLDTHAVDSAPVPPPRADTLGTANPKPPPRTVTEVAPVEALLVPTREVRKTLLTENAAKTVASRRLTDNTQELIKDDMLGTLHTIELSATHELASDRVLGRLGLLL